MRIQNLAPDTDAIMLTTDVGEKIMVSRDEEQIVWVVITLPDGTEHRMVLGDESETTKL